MPSGTQRLYTAALYSHLHFFRVRHKNVTRHPGNAEPVLVAVVAAAGVVYLQNVHACLDAGHGLVLLHRPYQTLLEIAAEHR